MGKERTEESERCTEWMVNNLVGLISGELTLYLDGKRDVVDLGFIQKFIAENLNDRMNITVNG